MYETYCLQSNVLFNTLRSCLELQVSKKHPGITFEHVPPTEACHRGEGQELCRSIPIAINIHLVFVVLIGKLLLSNHRSVS